MLMQFLEQDIVAVFMQHHRRTFSYFHARCPKWNLLWRVGLDIPLYGVVVTIFVCTPFVLQGRDTITAFMPSSRGSGHHPLKTWFIDFCFSLSAPPPPFSLSLFHSHAHSYSFCFARYPSLTIFLSLSLSLSLFLSLSLSLSLPPSHALTHSLPFDLFYLPTRLQYFFCCNFSLMLTSVSLVCRNVTMQVVHATAHATSHSSNHIESEWELAWRPTRFSKTSNFLCATTFIRGWPIC